MTEKQLIEKSTAESFLSCYNEKFGTTFYIKELSDSPDIICIDKGNNELSLEITLTQDRKGYIPALLGRSARREFEYVKVHGMGPASSLSGNVSEKLLETINKKMDSDYGSNVALVIRDSSPVGWDWGSVVQQLSNQLVNLNNPFDRGVWILTFNKEIFRVL